MRTLLDDDLATALGAAPANRWQIDRGPNPTSVHVERRDGRPISAVLTTRRPATSSTTIAHSWTATGIEGADVALHRLLDAVLADARQRGDAVVKWRSTDGVEPPGGFGFARMRAPYTSAPGTDGVTGFALWLRPVPHVEPPYYSQTSSFTCGAVTALLATEIRRSDAVASDGRGGFDPSRDADGNRDIELDFWRRASNYPSCEPVGLAVALRESLDDAAGTNPVEVFLDTDGPVLLESYTAPFDRAFREELQANSLRKALASDIAVRRDRVPVDEIAARVGGGELALLLIDLEPMFGFAVPHWVLAHAAADGVVVIDDPWISATWGETWVDAHELPVSTADLDRMLAWGDEGYRGVVFVTRA